MTFYPFQLTGGGGGGSVSSVAGGDGSVVATNPAGPSVTLVTGTLDQLAALHPPAADWSNNSHKITSLANGSAAQDAAAFGQIPVGGLAKQAATSTAGYTLINGTGNIITWTAPNDGLLHRVLLFCEMHVSSLLTGGSITVTLTLPDATVINGNQIIAGGSSSGIAKNTFATFLIEANTAFTLAQGTAVTGGAAVLWAEIWGS